MIICIFNYYLWRLWRENEKIMLSIAMISSLGLIADDHTEPNYSKFQANYFFSCPNEPACGAAFDK